MNVYNDTINFPNRVSDWPSVADNRSSVTVSPDQILWAEHYNKLANFVDKVQDNLLFFGTTQASGANASPDLSVQKVSRGLGIVNTTDALLQAVAPLAYSTPNPSFQIPGNVLPFEFVFTTNPNKINNLNGSNGGTVYGTTTVLFSDTIVGAYPLAEFSSILTATNIYCTSTFGYAGTVANPELHCQFFPQISQYTIRLSDTIIIRGCVRLQPNQVYGGPYIHTVLWGAS